MRRLYVHDSTGGPDLDVAGSIAGVALQPILGILPQWRIGARRGGAACAGSCRPHLTAGCELVFAYTGNWFLAQMVGIGCIPPFAFRVSFPVLRRGHVESSESCL